VEKDLLLALGFWPAWCGPGSLSVQPRRGNE